MAIRLTKRNERGVAYLALTDMLPKDKAQIEGSKEVLEGIYAMMQKLASYEEKEKTAKTRYSGETEWWGGVYDCCSCGSEDIWKNFKHCPNCGLELDWESEGE